VLAYRVLRERAKGPERVVASREQEANARLEGQDIGRREEQDTAGSQDARRFGEGKVTDYRYSREY